MIIFRSKLEVAHFFHLSKFSCWFSPSRILKTHWSVFYAHRKFKPKDSTTLTDNDDVMGDVDFRHGARNGQARVDLPRPAPALAWWSACWSACPDWWKASGTVSFARWWGRLCRASMRAPRSPPRRSQFLQGSVMVSLICAWMVRGSVLITGGSRGASVRSSESVVSLSEDVTPSWQKVPIKKFKANECSEFSRRRS